MADRIRLCRHVRFPCIVCDRSCGVDTIERSACSSWVHRQCVPMTSDQMRRFLTTDVILCAVWITQTAGAAGKNSLCGVVVPRYGPVASECVCDWLRDATGLDCGDLAHIRRLSASSETQF